MSSIRQSLPVYAIEGALLGIFMIAACCFGAFLEHPDSPAHQVLPHPLARRAIMGLAMGLTAVCLIYSRWGRRSGAHMNPAVTLSALRLGRIGRVDAFAYIVAQFLGAIVGVGAMALLATPWVSHPSVSFVVTRPGSSVLIAWLAEAAIAFGMMAMSIQLNRLPQIAPFTGCFAGALVAVYITLEAPASGMSLNPARTFGSAFWANAWTHVWIYFTAPVLGMLTAVELSRLLCPRPEMLCCKHSHSRRVPCYCRCNCLESPATFVSPMERNQRDVQNT